MFVPLVQAGTIARKDGFSGEIEPPQQLG